MQIEQAFVLLQPPAVVWPAFGDVALLVDCLPGAALAGEPVDGAWPLRFDIKLGPIAASFQGQGRLERDDATTSGRFEGQASDRKTGSRVKGHAAFRLLPADGGGTQVQVLVEHQLSGALAQFGRSGLVKQLAGTLAEQFAENLRARLAPVVAARPMPPPEDGPASEAAAQPSDTAVTATAATPPPPGAAPTPPAKAPLSAGDLLWRSLRRWLSALWARRRR